MRYLILILALVVHIACGQYHSSSASVGVNFENIAPPHLSGGASAVATSEQERPRNRRMYAMCPPNFQRIGTECFSLPPQQGSWLEAHFFCKDKNARLAEPEKFTDRKLREFLLKNDAQTGNMDPIWIGATYDWINKMWQWSISGRNLSYDGFVQNHPDQTLENHCAVFDPEVKYKWSSRTCVDKHRFICQHKMPKVSEKNRHKVYHRWNATYPNQLANEVILEVIDRKGKGRYNRRVIADGSNEEMVVPARPGHNRRRRPRPQHPAQQHENDVNYQQHHQQQPSTHPNDIQPHYNPTRHPRIRTTTLYPPSANTNDNEIIAPHDIITPVPDNAERRQQNPRRRTSMDRKLQRQREKELRRLQRKKERQEKMRREKQERMRRQREQRDQEKRRMREEKMRQRQQQQQQQQQQQREFDEIRQRENEAAIQRQQREKQLQEQQQQSAIERQQREKQLQEQQQQYKLQEIEELKKQRESEERKRTDDEEEERRRKAYLEKLHQQELEERAKKEEIQRQEYERKSAEERKQQEERQQLEQQKRKEYEERLKQVEDERARQAAEEQERKRLQDEANRRRMEEAEKQRQADLKKKLDEEEERLRLERLEEERRVEEQELARLRDEQRKRAEIQRKREQEIQRLEEEQRRIEEEEARIKQELEEAERRSRLEQEDEMKRTEQEARAKEEERKRMEEQEERERLNKLEQARRIEESRQEESKTKIANNIKNRLNSLPPELRKEFLEKRRQRRKEKLQQQQMARLNAA